MWQLDWHSRVAVSHLLTQQSPVVLAVVMELATVMDCVLSEMIAAVTYIAYRIYRRVYQVSSLLFLILVMTIIVIACTSMDTLILVDEGTNKGYPQVCINGVWRYVCDDGWTGVSAERVCTQVGFFDGDIGE